MKVRILIVDDQGGVRAAIRKHVLLAVKASAPMFDSPPEIDECDGSATTLDPLIAARTYDVAVVDYKLMGRTGVEAIRAIRPQDQLCETKIVMYTAVEVYQALDVALKALQAGAFTFVRKGGDDADFISEVERALKAVWLERNRAMVGKFVDRSLREKLANPTFMESLRSGRVVEKGFLFCDITGSTPFVKLLQQPLSGHRKVGPVLRELLSWICQILQGHGGIVDKFIGDEVMAYFGDTIDADRLSADERRRICDSMVAAALEIRTGFQEQVMKTLEKLEVDHVPTTLPWVKSVISFDSVVWAVLGSEEYLDLTILTDGVVRTARVMQHLEGDKKLVGAGDIYLLDGVWKSLTDERFALDGVRKVELRDFHDEVVQVRNVTGYGKKFAISA